MKTKNFPVDTETAPVGEENVVGTQGESAVEEKVTKIFAEKTAEKSPGLRRKMIRIKTPK